MLNIFKYFIIILVIFSPILASASIENIDNAGFVPGPIWFSKYPVFVDDEIKIYTALYNNSQYNISGDLFFFNNEKSIGDSSFEMIANSGATDIWIDWVAEKGDINIKAEIKNVSIINKQEELMTDIDFTDTQIASSKIFIDFDNDNDGIGNKTDDDDDNDGVNDLAEIAEGSNPFVVDHEIPTSTKKELKKGIEENQNDSIIDKIDDSVMSFFNKITKNKVDQFVDSFSKDKVEKLEIKKEEIKNKINFTVYDSLDNIVKLKTVKSTSTSAVNALNSADVITSSEYLPKDLDETKVKNKINIFFKNSLSKIYLFIVNTLIFFLGHPLFLFLLIFLFVYFSIKKVIRFFIG